MNLRNFWILGFLAGVGVGMVVASARFERGAFAPNAGQAVQQWWSGFWQNFSAEMFGVFLTFILFEQIINRRALKRSLVRQMRSRAKDAAVRAVYELREEGWLEDGALRGGRFARVNLQGADLRFARLEGADMGWANLEGACLCGAELEGAALREAHLEGVDLGWANLTGAYLPFARLEGAALLLANLEGANLCGAHLEGADLGWANLEGAALQEANLEGTTLPDRSKWSAGTDMARFTDPAHPEFWRSDNPFSPAYRDEEAPEDDRRDDG